MKTLVVYDSVQGNTEKIAHAIGAAIGDDAQVLRAATVDPDTLKAIDLLIVGAPTHGGRPTPPVQEFLDKLPASTMTGKRFAAFDTRIPAKWVKIFNFAAPRIAKQLGKLGGKLVGSPEGFFVEGSKPPVLLDGELERAAGWAREIATAANQQ
jgi:flavodoxin